MPNEKSSKLIIGEITIDYISFGSGGKNLIMIPGLADGLNSVCGKEKTIADAYKLFADDFTVYIFSRREPLPFGFTSRDMASDIKLAMNELNIDKADVFGVSQGGTIAQFLAIDFPESVNKLVLAVTYSKPNEFIVNTIERWNGHAVKADYEGLFIDMTESTYSEAFLKEFRKQYPVLTKTDVPESYERFFASSNACATHDSYALLDKITAPTLILGGKEDKVVSPQASYEMHEKIKNSQIYMYDGLGHGAFDEGIDFNRRFYDFLMG